MKAIPRPLLIVVVVVVILGVISCGAAGSKGKPDASEASWNFTPEAIPGDEVRGDGCTVDDNNMIRVSGGCTLTIVAQQFPPRELRLRVVAGVPNVTILQEVNGHSEETSEDFEKGETIEVSSAAGDEEIDVVLTCIPVECTVEVRTD